jgi:hypothetical protein
MHALANSFPLLVQRCIFEGEIGEASRFTGGRGGSGDRLRDGAVGDGGGSDCPGEDIGGDGDVEGAGGFLGRAKT